MKLPGQRIDLRTAVGRVSGYWDQDARTVSTYRGGQVLSRPAETLDQARDALRAMAEGTPTQPSSPVELPF